MSDERVIAISLDTSAAFKRWWHDEGSGMPPMSGEEAIDHVRRVCEIAWANGAYVATIKNEGIPRWVPISNSTN